MTSGLGRFFCFAETLAWVVSVVKLFYFSVTQTWLLDAQIVLLCSLLCSSMMWLMLRLLLYVECRLFYFYAPVREVELVGFSRVNSCILSNISRH